VSLDEFLQKTSTVAFLVIRNDSVLFEKYYNGYNRSQIATVFSVSKSITSLLVGLAVDDGYIESVDDPVTKYIPELLDADPHFQKLTVEHLLNMRSGIKYDESYSNPFSAMAKLYYGNNQLGQIKKMKFAHEPGTVHSYQSVSTALLGIIVEKTTGKELGKYLEEKIGIPLGFENKATWSLDDKKHRSTKAYQGLNITAIDLAKIGRLYLNGGNWNGKQIIDSAWITKSTTPDVKNDGYQYQWQSGNIGYGNNYYPDSVSAKNVADKLKNQKYYKIWQDKRRNNQWGISIYLNAFCAIGINGQTLYVDPDKKIIIVRLGKSEDLNYHPIIYNLVKNL
jgi:CubicO group peptidase (beta-lactamase class C family)